MSNQSKFPDTIAGSGDTLIHSAGIGDAALYECHRNGIIDGVAVIRYREYKRDVNFPSGSVLKAGEFHPPSPAEYGTMGFQYTNTPEGRAKALAKMKALAAIG